MATPTDDSFPPASYTVTSMFPRPLDGGAASVTVPEILPVPAARAVGARTVASRATTQPNSHPSAHRLPSARLAPTQRLPPLSLSRSSISRAILPDLRRSGARFQITKMTTSNETYRVPIFVYPAQIHPAGHIEFEPCASPS